MKNKEREQFWENYYAGIAKKNVPWLDYSNKRVQAQTWALNFEAAGSIEQKRCLDVGCGNGQFTNCIKALQPSEITGIDIVERFIKNNKRKFPGIQWLCGQISDLLFAKSLGVFDRIFFVEVLQYLPIIPTIRSYWKHLDSKGRIVAVVPNVNCPIVQRSSSRFNGRYVGADGNDLVELFQKLPSIHCFGIRGLHFQDDQCIVPYSATPWTTNPKWLEEPNRLLFVIKKL
jgi:2-polyprenyl-3-methyl-5-hydroxy-6-metoxy-1,4-benzoquinol methylase